MEAARTLSAVPQVKVRVPGHLRPATRRFYRQTVEEYVLERHHLKLLLLACEAMDRCEEAREELARCGTYCVDRFGVPKVHPAAGVEREARLQVARLLRELDLDDDPVRGGPPAPRSMRRS